LTQAQTYLAQLVARPVADAGYWQYRAYVDFMNAYAHNGALDSAIAAGRRAFASIPTLPDYRIRAQAASADVRFYKVFLTFAMAVSGRPNGRGVIDSVTQLLTYAVTVSPALLARDPSLRVDERNAQADLAAVVQVVSVFGRQAPPLVATGWFNQPLPSTPSTAAPDARSKPLDDGLIRIIEFGHLLCGWCKRGRDEGERWQQHLPAGVRFEYYDSADDDFGGEPCTPAEMVAHLRQLYVAERHYTYPIAVWAAPKDSTWDGGHVTRNSPIAEAFAASSPSYVVVDGHGIIRWYHSGWSDDLWDRLRRDVLPPLLRERQAANGETAQIELERRRSERPRDPVTSVPMTRAAAALPHGQP
jgi:hypothetical protein